MKRNGFIGKKFHLKDTTLIQKALDFYESYATPQKQAQTASNLNLLYDNNRLKYASNLFSALNVKAFTGVTCNFSIYNESLGFSAYSLSELELHIRHPGKDCIPPHQDMFYHACRGLDKFKIIVACTKCNFDSGFLVYSLSPLFSEIPLVHVSSATPAFSSFIPNFDRNPCIACISPELMPGETCAHFMHSIHWSSFNRQDLSIFLVFRYDLQCRPKLTTVHREYSRVYAEHKNRLLRP